MLGQSDVVARLSLSSPTGGWGQDIPNLSVVNLEVVNSGNKDFSSFPFGLTLSDGDYAVHCDIRSSDRHHQAEIITPFGPAAPAKELDFRLAPFNRRDAYTFLLYVVALDQKAHPGEIHLSSKEPVIFRTGPTIQEITLEAASRVVLDVGRVRITLGVPTKSPTK
jgi:hypothetical protein